MLQNMQKGQEMTEQILYENILDENEKSKLGELIEKGGQGILTEGDLLEVFPEAMDEPEKLEAILAALENEGIELIVHDNDSLPKPEESSQAETAEELVQQDKGVVAAKQNISSDDLVELYFSDAARKPLLSKEEEVELAKLIEKGKKARQELALGQDTPARRKELQRAVKKGWQARKKMVTSNTRLVISVAKRFLKRGVPFLDLIQEGNIGLIRAIKKFDYRRGFRFSTYATWWIRQAVSRAISYQGRTIRIPVHMGDKLTKLYRVRQQLKQQLKRDPTNEEMAQELDVSTREVEKMMRISRRTMSLDKPIRTEDDASLGDFIPDEESPSPEESVNASFLRTQLMDLIADIPEREGHILMLRYGLMDGQPRSLSEVGRTIGISRERVRQIESKALRRLRKANHFYKLRDYLDLTYSN